MNSKPDRIKSDNDIGDSSVDESKNLSDKPQNKSKSSKNRRKSKNLAIIVISLTAVFFFIGVVVAPLTLTLIDPIGKIKEAERKQCEEKCEDSESRQCIEMCLTQMNSDSSLSVREGLKTETDSLVDMIPTPIENEDQLNTTESNQPSSNTVNSVENLSMTLEVGLHSPDKILKPVAEYHTVTIENTTTGISFTEARQDQVIKYYDLDDGNYRITTSTIPGKVAASYLCYDCHREKTDTVESYGDNKPTTNVNIKKGIPVGVVFVYHDP